MGAQTVWAVVRSLESTRLHLQKRRGKIKHMYNPDCPCDDCADHKSFLAEDGVCPHDTVIYRECLECDAPITFVTRARQHAFCWAWKLALVVPAIHLVLHALAFVGINIPHPESIALIP